MPYAEKKGEYTHMPYPVPSSLVNRTRELYRLNRTDNVTKSEFTTVVDAAKLAHQHEEGSYDTWAQLLRLTCHEIEDIGVLTENVKVFRSTIDLLMRNGGVADELLDSHLQLTCLDPNDKRAADALESSVLPQADMLFKDQTVTSNIIVVDSVLEPPQQWRLHAHGNEQTWTLQCDTAIQNIRVQSLATATVNYYLGLVET